MPPIHYHVKAPGKLMIAGEYAVLEPGRPAVVAAVDRYITVDAEESLKNILSLPQLGIERVVWTFENGKAKLDREDKRLRFIANAFAVFSQLMEEKSLPVRPLHLTVTSELDDEATGKKYGLGSSAAILVSVFTALLYRYRKELQPTKDMIFKLAVIAHLKTQGNGSGADIAASTYGGWISYTAFRPAWILSQLQQQKKISEILASSWPYLSIVSLTPPSQLYFCTGWTGNAAATGPMVDHIGLLREKEPVIYSQFLEKSTAAVLQLVEGFEQQNAERILASITANRRALQYLGAYADIEIETEGLRQLCTIAGKYGAGKSSGAGGGDCGIAFINGDNLMEELHREWKKAGIQPLKINVSDTGVTVRDL